MFQPQFFYEAGKARSGTALIPFFDSTSVAFGISTRNGNTVVDWGDGSSSNIAPIKMRDYADGSRTYSNFVKSYSSALNGNVSVKFLQGLKDVYSVYLGVFHDANQQQSKLNILDVETFFKQFPNLFSLCIEEYAYQTTARMSVIKGDLAKLPNSVERVLINQAEILNAATDFTLNFSSYTNLSNLKFFQFQDTTATTAQSTIKVIGDVGKIPTSCQFFYLQKASAGSSITYTAGKIWASAFDTLSIPLSLTTAELDALLADMDGSILTKTGAGVISVLGDRSSASDAFVASLQSKGFTVNVTRNPLNINSYSDSALLRLDFQNNFDVYSNSGLNIAAGGTFNQPTFALSGRKAGEYCAVFNGSQSIKTTTNLPINSDKVTVAFWMKTTQTTVAAIAELSPSWFSSGVNAFATIINVTANKLYMAEQTTNTVRNIRETALSINDNIWKRFSVVIDRTNPTATKISIYINGVLASTTASTNGSTTGNFVNNILFVGQRNGSTIGFNGSLMHLEVLNYPITATEALADYNSFL
jgi:hypothetical protein